MNYIKIKNFCSPEDNIKRVEEDIFFSHNIYNPTMVLYPEYIKELLKISGKKKKRQSSRHPPEWLKWNRREISSVGCGANETLINCF